MKQKRYREKETDGAIVAPLLIIYKARIMTMTTHLFGCASTHFISFDGGILSLSAPTAVNFLDTIEGFTLNPIKFKVCDYMLVTRLLLAIGFLLFPRCCGRVTHSMRVYITGGLNCIAGNEKVPYSVDHLTVIILFKKLV